MASLFLSCWTHLPKRLEGKIKKPKCSSWNTWSCMTFLSRNTVCLSLPEAFLSIWVSALFFPVCLGTSRHWTAVAPRRWTLCRGGKTRWHWFHRTAHAFIRQNLQVAANYLWPCSFSCRLKALSCPVRGSCGSKTFFFFFFFTPKSHFPALLGAGSRRTEKRNPESEENYECCSGQRNGSGTALSSAGWPLVFADISHFFSLSPVAAVANKSLSASVAWNRARSSWRSRRSRSWPYFQERGGFRMRVRARSVGSARAARGAGDTSPRPPFPRPTHPLQRQRGGPEFNKG